MKVKALLLFFTLCLCRVAISQVHLPSGAAQFNLPIFSYNDQDKLSTDISLNYIDGNGLKVSEAASEVGTGWNLALGGVISREQRGLPDDQRRAMILQNPLPDNLQMSQKEYIDQYFPNGYLFSFYNSNDTINNEGSYVKMIQGYSPSWKISIPEKEYFAADREQDIFRLNLGETSMEFVIDKNMQVKILNGAKVKIEIVIENMLASKIKTCISKFIVTGLDGIKYIFSNKELSELCTYDQKRYPDEKGFINLDENYVSIDQSSKLIALIGKRTGNYIVTKWHLSEIINPLSNKKIAFTYEGYDIDLPTRREMTYFDGASVTIYKEILKALRIKKIKCPDSTDVELIYDNIPRVDIPNKNPLKEIQIKKNNELTSKFLFQHQYFFTSLIKPYNYQFTDNEKFMARLSLKSVQRLGNNNVAAEPPYSFEYYTGTGNGAWLSAYNIPQIYYGGGNDIVPPMCSFKTDNWGYYNNKNIHRGNDIDDFEYPYSYVPAFSAISYECENYRIKSHKIPTNGGAKNGILKQIIYPTGGSLSFEYEQNTAFFGGQNVFNGGVRVNKTIQYNGINHNNDIVKEFRYLKDDGITSSGWGYEDHTYEVPRNKRIYKEAGGKRPVTGFKDLATATISTTFSNVLRSVTLGAGMSIGKAFLSAAVQNIIANVIVQILVDLFTPSTPAYIDYTGVETHNISFQSSNPLPSLYSRVEVVDKINNVAKNGKSVFEFTSDADQPLLVPVLTIPFSNQPRYFNSFYGLPKRVTIFDSSGSLLKETINEYEIKSSTGSSSMNWMGTKYTYDAFPSGHSSYLNEFGNIVSNKYNAIIDYTELKTTKERVYNKNPPDYSESTTSYTYNPNNLQLNTQKTIDSKGRLIETKVYYPQDYNLAALPVLQALTNNNNITIPISTETWHTKPGGTPELLSASATEFGVAPNGDYKPVKVYGLETDKPVPQSTIGIFNPNALVRDASRIKPVSEIIYNNNGNTVQENDLQGSKSNSIIYGYNNQYPVAVISNAKVADVAYNSFEESGNKGGWNITNATILAQSSPTGNNCLSLTAGSSVTTAVVMNKEYKLSFWATSNSFTVGGLVPVITSPSLNGWTYYEFNIPSGAPSPVITGNCKIDELRLYPKVAAMETTTYKLGVGKTSSCDINNRIQYYEYDALGRIVKIKDENRNVIKTYEYHFKSQ